MSDLDYEHISNLFAIVKGNAEHSGKFTAIQDYAFRELNKINDTLKEKRAGEKKAEEEKAQQEAGDKAERELALKPKAIPSQKFDESGKPIEDKADNFSGDTQPTIVDRRV